MINVTCQKCGKDYQIEQDWLTRKMYRLHIKYCEKCRHEKIEKFFASKVINDIIKELGTEL